jgi:hypothetical protein
MLAAFWKRADGLTLLGQGRAGGHHQHFLYRALEQILRPAPGIALVVDESLRHAEHERHAVGPGALISPSIGAMLAKPCSVR